MKSKLQPLGVFAGVILLVWLFIASVVFQFRHPWATDTERFLYIGRALMFEKVPYNEARPRE